MPLYPQVDDFRKENPRTAPVSLASEIPKDMDIFYRSFDNFIPEGKKLEDLTKEELDIVKNRYRFDHYRPGVYQGITGFAHML